MKTTIIVRTNTFAGPVVSTVRVGRTHETSIVVAGRVSDPIRSDRKDDALLAHDKVCEFVNYPSMRDLRTKRHEQAARMLADVGAS